jgi:two-component system NtrC family response regulator
MAAISSHPWPGNVRELENRMKRAVVMSENRLIEAEDLELEPVEPQADDLDLRAARTRAELDVLQKALARSRGRLAHAAKLLGVSRPTLYTLLEAHGLSVETAASSFADSEAGGPTPDLTLRNMG